VDPIRFLNVQVALGVLLWRAYEKFQDAILNDAALSPGFP